MVNAILDVSFEVFDSMTEIGLIFMRDEIFLQVQNFSLFEYTTDLHFHHHGESLRLNVYMAFRRRKMH